jgi:hypothetical protein
MSLRNLGALIIALATAGGTISCAISSATSSRIDSEEQGSQWELTHFSDIPVWIAGNNVSTGSLVRNRKIFVLLEEEHFTDEDLKKVFTAMAAHWADPEFLIITALSDRNMLQQELGRQESTTYYTLREGTLPRQPEEDPNRKISYFRAYYLRMHDEERLGYSLEPERGSYTTIYLRRRGIAYTADVGSDLVLASYEGDIDKVRALLAAGADVNAKDKDGNTPLLEATLNFHGDIVDMLLSSGANVNAKGEDGDTVLLYAAGHGDIELVESLLRRNAKVNVQNVNGDCALIRAASNGHVEVVKALLLRGANVDEKDSEGWTALMWAVANGHVETVRLLLANGADPAAKNNEGQSALELAKGPLAAKAAKLLRRPRSRR